MKNMWICELIIFNGNAYTLLKQVNNNVVNKLCFTALVGTLKAAKRKKIVTYKGELLLQGVHDDVDIVLLQDEE